MNNCTKTPKYLIKYYLTNLTVPEISLDSLLFGLIAVCTACILN